MSSDSSRDGGNASPNTDRTPLLGFLRDAKRPTSQADEGSSINDDSTDIDSVASNVAITSSVVDSVALGLDSGLYSGLQQKQDLDNSGYGTVNERNGSDHEPVDDLRLSSEQPTSADDVQSKYIGVSVGRFWLIFGGILAAWTLASFDSTLMASSHPVITSYFHSSNSASWLSTVFFLTYTAFQSIFGRISDITGRRPLYLFALTIFVLTTVWCALAQSIGSFIAARALSGLGAGGSMSMGMIIISDLVRIEHRGICQSYINLAWGLGSASGAALGGFLCDRLGWRWMFGIQVPLILVMLVTAWLTTPTNLGPNLAKTGNLSVWQTIKGFDIVGAILLTLSVTFLILGLNLGGNVLSWGHPVVISSFIACTIAAAFLLRVEAGAFRPVMPLELLTRKPRANLIFSNFLGNIAMHTLLFNVPLYFQAVKLDSATNSGLRLAVPALGNSTAGAATGFIITWTRRIRPTWALGSVCFLIGSVCMACIRPGIPDWLCIAFVTTVSLGLGFAYPSTTMGILAVSSQEDQAVATTTLVLWRSLGTVMGVALSSLILQNALILYLDQLVTGKYKADIIYEVRRSVHAIVELDPLHQKQVIDAYSRSLQITFALSAAMSVVMVIITVPIKLPRLAKKS